jgi:hypothetical protein
MISSLASALVTAGLSLHLVSPAAAVSAQTSPPVSVIIHESEGLMTADFVVKTASVYAKSVLEAGQYPYMFDVVELFIAADGDQKNLPYYEFELSANDQTFAVKIIDPKTNRIDGVDLGLVHSVERIKTVSGFEWKAHMELPLKRLGWNGDRARVFGNAFAVLGQPHHRTYWSLSLPAQTKPNFHLPQFFKPLL